MAHDDKKNQKVAKPEDRELVSCSAKRFSHQLVLILLTSLTPALCLNLINVDDMLLEEY